jgi:hypothetical protein
MIMYLVSDTNNRAETVLNLFAQSCFQYGVPSRVRSDHGGENIDVALFVSLLRPANSHITGKSVHNNRIERLWRDVFLQVIEPFYSMFYTMEDEGILNAESDLHRCALHHVFLPVITDRLNVFRQAWNTHRIRTAKNCSPEQLWTTGMLDNHESEYRAVEEIFGNTPSLNTRIEDAVGQFGLDVGDFNFEPHPASREASQLSDEMLALVQEQTYALPNEIAKYKKVLECITNTST